MSYQRERGECIALLTKHGLPYPAIETLLRAATTINRLAELACSSEAADRDRIRCPRSIMHHTIGRPLNPTAKQLEQYPCLCDGDHSDDRQAIPRIRLQDYRAEQRAIKAVPAGWRVITSGDPRGYTLRVIPPAYAEENKTRSEHDPRTIGIPPGPSRLHW